jgi:hypothetical protein
MNNRETNELVIKQVAQALEELNEEVVFVGGAVVALYADDPAAEDVRPTRDVDLFLEIVSYGQLSKLQMKLDAKGFYPAREEEVMCRFKHKEILVDIMSTNAVGWAPADKWFKPGLSNLEQYTIGDIKINILNISYFLATKFNAYHDRDEDPRLSKHFEDIIYLLDNRRSLVKELNECSGEIKEYLITEFRDLLKPQYEEAILAHLNYETQTERFQLIKEKLNLIINK